MVRSGIFLFVLFVFFFVAQARSPPKRVKSTEKKQGSLMQGTERENKLPEPWYGLKNWVITTHPPTERSIRRDFIENKKTNYENWFWKIWHGVLFVHSFPGLYAWNLSLLKISFIRFNGCFLFLFLFSLFLITVFIFVCLRRGGPSSGAVLARSAITGSSPLDRANAMEMRSCEGLERIAVSGW